MIQISKNYRSVLNAIRYDLLEGTNNFAFTFNAQPENLPRACYMCLGRIGIGIKIEKDCAENWLCYKCLGKMLE